MPVSRVACDFVSLAVGALVIASCASGSGGDATTSSTTSTTVAATSTTSSSTTTTIPRSTFEETFGGSRRDRGIDVTRLSGGGYAVIGSSDSDPSQHQDVYLVRLDPGGGLLWERRYGGEGLDNGWAVVEREDGGLTLFGFTDSMGAGGTDMYLIQTDADGDQLSEHTYGGPEDEYGWDIAPLEDGGYVLGGQTESYGAGDIDGYIVSVGPNGEERWTQTVGGEGEDRLYSIVATHDGGVVLTGTTTTDSAGRRDAYLVKLDRDGSLLWERRFGGEQDDVGHAVRVRGEDGLVVTGYTASFGSASYDAWVIATDGDGKPDWETRYGDAGDDRTISGEETPDGGFILTGYTKSYGAVDWDVFLVRLDEEGTVLWHRLFGARGADTGYTVIALDDGGFMLTGETTSTGTGGDMYVLKVDADGGLSS